MRIPENVCRQSMVDPFALEYSFGKTIQAKVGKEQAKGSHHGYQAKIGGRQEAGEYNDGDDWTPRPKPEDTIVTPAPRMASRCTTLYLRQAEMRRWERMVYDGFLDGSISR